ncbi:FixH family protein [Blattabacterium cuenoti]|uniref:FixH family protein n=1 Tax=Blattabacterium cuenoti TaxID=1653831 RepID=UPI00163CA27C|nr:FixH family protein [Blattabacterium cuenoti]
MKIKFSWDVGIVLSLITFMIFIIYIAFFFPNVESQLVSDRYYEEEIKYQDTINEKKNVLNLDKKVEIIVNNNGIKIIIPYDNKISNDNIIHGYFTLFRSSSKDLDVTRHFKISKYSNVLFIPKKMMKKGCYKIIIKWKYHTKKYLFEKNIFWK